MKVLLFLNGFEGCQTGIEDGFRFVLDSGKITSLRWFYFEDFAKKNSYREAQSKMVVVANDLQPNLIIFFHLGNFPISDEFILSFKNLESDPILVYDEGDMYGTWAKPITSSMKKMFRGVDIVSIRGLGKFFSEVKKYNSNIIYTPHHNDIARFDVKLNGDNRRVFNLVFIGNAVKPRFLSFIRRMPGAKEREKFVKYLGEYFPSRLKLYGNGWDNFIGDQGPVDFYKQSDIYKGSWITVAYEHYPKVPYYFSNRLPIALMNGSLYVCHYHEGYERLFPNCDFIFFFRTKKEAIDIINYLLSLGEEELRIRSLNARNFAYRHYHPNVIWMNFLNNICNYDNQTYF